MKKSFKKLFLLMAVVMTAVVCFACEASALDAEGKCGDNVYWTYNNKNGELIISGSGEMEPYDGFYSYSPFYDNIDIKTVIIKKGVTSISSAVFQNCTKLKNITIPEGITSIGSNAFQNTAYFNDVSNWENDVLYIGKYLIEAKSDIYGTYNIKKGTLLIADNAFQCCYELQNITIPDSVRNIGSLAFYDTAYYNKTSNWENDVLYIGKHLIEAKSNVSNTYKIKSGTKTIADSAFSSCYELTGITMPNSIISIGDRAFYMCYSLKSVVIPNSVIFIGNSAFYNCDISSITIPNGITSIGKFTFYDCDSLVNITIPKSVTNIGGSAFNYCTALKNVNYASTPEEWKKINIGNNNGWLIFAKINYSYGCDHKTLTTLKAVTPTCTKEGKTEGKKCSTCGKVTVAQKTVAKKGHTYKTTTTKATLKKNGKQVTKCTVCGDIKSSKTIYYPKSVKLSTSTYTYNGKTKTPSVVVKDSKGNTLKKDTDYTVKYASGRKNPGKYTVTVTFKGKYSGTKKLTLTIKPKAPSITSIYSKTKGKAVVKWANVTGESGFQLYYSTSKNGTYKKVKSYAVNKLAGSKTKLKSGKKYYFKVRAYKKTSNGTVYSSWSSIKSVKIK